MNHLDSKFTKHEKEMIKIREMVHTYRDRQASEIADESSRVTKIEAYIDSQVEKVRFEI